MAAYPGFLQVTRSYLGYLVGQDIICLQPFRRTSLEFFFCARSGHGLSQARLTVSRGEIAVGRGHFCLSPLAQIFVGLRQKTITNGQIGIILQASLQMG